jgi:prepilin-type N-terminal cleavage/methylation domain-containing protein
VSRPPHSSAGFTLVELIVALAIMMILMGALTSAILIATRAVPPANDPVVATLAAGSELDTLADDLRYATAFAVWQPRVVQFTVPDRTGDGSPEEIRCEWSGVPGDPLRRQMNGGAWAVLVPSVQSLVLSYNTKALTTTSTQTVTVTSPETLLSFFNGWSGVTPIYNSHILGAATWATEFFTIDQVTLPGNARNLRISRVQLMLQKVAATGSISVAIHLPTSAGNPQPAASPIGTAATVPVSSLPTSMGWVDIALPADVLLATPATQFVLVAKGSVANAAYCRNANSTSAPQDATPTALWTTDSGGTWQPTKTSDRYKNDHPFYAYGTYQYDTTQTVTSTTYYLRSVGIALQAAGTTSPLLATAVDIYAQPQVTP